MANESSGAVPGETPGRLAFDEHRLKHMEFIQTVVARLAGNSFFVKGWAITVAGAFIGFALNGDDVRLALAALVPTIAFWGLDASFLKSERLFRTLYDQVRSGDEQVEPFYMSATSSEFVRRVRHGQTNSDPSAASFWRTLLRLTISWFYLPLIAASCIVATIVYARG
jgi:hypothetical protein